MKKEQLRKTTKLKELSIIMIWTILSEERTAQKNVGQREIKNILKNWKRLIDLSNITLTGWQIDNAQNTSDVCDHRRRRKTRERAKVVAAVWGIQNLLTSFDALATVFCTRTIMKNRMNSSFSSKQPEAIHPILQIVLLQNSSREKELTH